VKCEYPRAKEIKSKEKRGSLVVVRVRGVKHKYSLRWPVHRRARSMAPARWGVDGELYVLRCNQSTYVDDSKGSAEGALIGTMEKRVP